MALCLLLAPAAWAQIEVPAGNPTGTGGGTARKPLGNFYGFERSAMIYTPSEINGSGSITAIGFYVDAVSSPAATPAKVYLKTVGNSTFAAATTVAATVEATAADMAGATVAAIAMDTAAATAGAEAPPSWFPGS